MTIQRENPSKKSRRRLPDWDYATPGLYFVTICTQKHQWFFGKVIDEQMHKNQMGILAEEKWLSIQHHHANVILDKFVVMPNHIHGILCLTDDNSQSNERNVATLRATSLRNHSETTIEYFTRISPKSGSLSTIIRDYKSAVTREIRKNISNSFAWQPRYYDHIIRTEEDLENLREYIQLNPANWQPNLSEALTHA